MALTGTAGLSREWAAVMLLGIVALAKPAAALPDAAVARRRAAAARARLTEITDRDTGPDRSPEPDRSPVPEGSARLAGGGGWDAGGRGQSGAAVTVRGLVAGWDPDRPPALTGLDLDLAAGSRTAVRGPSGSGKSTLAAVLAGFLAPRAGAVHVHGSGAVTLVGDDTGHIFASTVRENLRLAAPAATDAALTAALHRVGLDDWLGRLPDGLDTWLGTGGSTMSGGERRRLATARALLADPALLILDEPTEGLDPAGAQALMADLLGAADGRTVLILTHRIEGLDLVDRQMTLRSPVPV